MAEEKTAFRAKQFYEYRIYEGEYLFHCGSCQTVFVFYAFEDEDDVVEYHVSSHHAPACPKCGNFMGWAGWSGYSDITNGLVRLVDEGHWMAAIAILAAFVEFQIDNLLWAVLVESGLSREKATAIANGTIPRGDAIRMVRDLLGRRVKNIVIQIRNEVVHGRAFGRTPEHYASDFEAAFRSVEDWVGSISRGQVPSGEDFTEMERWVLSMTHWVNWFGSKLKIRLRNVRAASEPDEAKASESD